MEESKQISSSSLVNLSSRQLDYLTNVDQIVDKHCAVLDATWEDQIGLNADHQNMCKFASREDVSYQIFLASTKRILEAQANKNKDAREYYYHK